MLAAVMLFASLSLVSEERHSLVIEPGDPRIEGHGPSKTIVYTPVAEDATLFVSAESQVLDLVLRIEIEGDEAKGDAAARITGGKPERVHEDDDSGGGTSPFVSFEVKGRSTVRISVAAKEPTVSGAVEVVIFEASETERTRSAAAAALSVLEEARRQAESGEMGTARSNLVDCVDRLLATEGAESSPVIQEALSRLYFDAGRLGELGASLKAERSLATFRGHAFPPRHPRLLRTRGNLAFILRATGRLEEAKEIEEDILEIFSQTLPPDHRDLRSARLNLGATLGAMGDLIAARALLEAALDDAALGFDDPNTQSARLNLASIRLLQGDLVGARAIQERVLEARSRTLPRDHPSVQAVRQNLAATLVRMGDLAGAQRLQEEVLAASTRTLPADHPQILTAREGVAFTLMSLGHYEESRVLLTETIEAMTQSLPQDHPDLQQARCNLGFAMAQLGELEKARSLQESVLESLSRTLPADHLRLHRGKANLAWTLARLGEASQSRDLARQVARGTLARFSVLGALSISEIETATANSLEAASHVLSLVSGAGIFPLDPKGEAEAFALCETLRNADGVLMPLLRSISAEPRARELQEHVRTAQKEIARLAGDPNQERGSLVEAIARRDRIERTLLEIVEKDSTLKRLLPKTDPAAISSRLGEHEAAVGFWSYNRSTIDAQDHRISSERSYLAWVLEGGKPFIRIELGPAVPIEEAVDAWRAALGAPVRRGLTLVESIDRSIDGKGDRVRALIFDPLRAYLENAERVWIAAAGALHMVPLDALPDGDGVIGDRFEIVVRASLSELTVEDSSSSLAAPSLLALGGIDYDREAEPIATSGDVSRSGSTGAAIHALRGGSAPAAAGFSWSFPRLPATRREVDVVGEYFADAFEGSRVTILTRRVASRDAFERLARDYRFLHLATHGWFAPESVSSLRDERPIDEQLGFGTFMTLLEQVIGLAPSLLCGLAFSGANAPADRYGRVHGIMTAHELMALDLSACEIAVLSACETAVGLQRGAEGVASLQQALRAAGVRTTITSLWTVPDEATLELMAEFYRRIWILKEPKGQALWRAKRKLRDKLDANGEPLHGPRTWAGWVLSGDPD